MILSTDYWILFLVAIGTLFIVLCTFSSVKDVRVRVAITLSALSIFLYSGYGIALSEVDNSYVYKYLIALFFFYLPFSLLFKNKKGSQRNGRRFESYLDNHPLFLKTATYVYFILIIIPLLFPRFRLFNVFISGITIEGIYDYLNASAADPFSRLTSSLAVFFRPFFYAYITFVLLKKPKSLTPLLLFLADVLIDIMDSCYIGRAAMVNRGLVLFFMLFCIKKGEFRFTKKHGIAILSIIVALIPFLYAYTFIRTGADVEQVTFGESLELLIASEVTYPTYYDHILSSPVFEDPSPLAVLLWLIFLPVPTVIWPSKPSLANDVFTYSITGLHRTDYGYSSLLPSFLGESFMYFGEHFYWVFTFLMGFVFALILKYLSNNKYMLLFMLVLAVRLTAAGRAGATAAIPSFVNGVLFVLLVDWFVIRPKKNRV